MRDVFLFFSKMIGCGEVEWWRLSEDERRCVGYSSYKELSNFYFFLESLDLKDLNFEEVECGRQKKCLFKFLDSNVNNFCLLKNFNISDFNNFIRALCLYSIQEEMLFQKYDNSSKRDFSVEKIINSEMRFIVKLINWIGSSLISKEIGDMDRSSIVKLLKISIFLRYSFNNKVYKFEFIKNKWMFSVDDLRINLLDKLYFINNDVKLFRNKVVYHGSNKNIDIVENKNYNYSLWIDKFDQIKSENSIIESGFLEDSSYGIKLVLDSINFLNSIRFEVNKDVLFETLGIMNKTEIYKDCPDMIMAWIALNDLKFILSFGDWFYLNYILDTRTRVYCKNIPINPQLIKILRVLIVPKIEGDFLKTIRDFIFNNLNIFDIKEIFNCLDHINLLIEVWKDKIIMCGLNRVMDLESKNLDKESVKKYLFEIVFLQQLMDISIRFGKYNANKKEMIKDGRKALELKENFWSSEDLNEYLENKEIKNWLRNNEVWIKINWYNDASASVIQLLTIKLLTTDNFTLKLANIFENDTEFKDIYDFVRFKICSKNKELEKWINRKIIKRIIMPGIYGQRIPKMLDECEKILKNNSEWIDLDKNFKKNTILDINKKCWEVLKELDLDILEYLNLTRKLTKVSKVYYWKSMLDMPIIIGKSIKLDRKKIIKKLIKDKDNIKKIEKLKEKLNKDDINYIRKNVRLGPNSYNKKYIKIRIKIKSNILDTKALERGLCPSSIHSEDASILIKVIKECSDLNIGIIPIHDSVGSRIFFSSLIKCIYKKKFIEYIDYILSEKEFPINDIVLKKIDKKFECERINKLNKFLEIKKKIIEQIKKSNNLFN